MDPNECWAAIVAAISETDKAAVDREALVENLRNLARWVESGGVIPDFYK